MNTGQIGTTVTSQQFWPGFRLLLALVGACPAAVNAPLQQQTPDADAAAQAQAGSILSAAKSGRLGGLWRGLRQSSDNSVRSYLIHMLNRLDSRIVIRQLRRENDASVRRALILALGSYTEDQISLDERRKLTALLLRWYEVDNDAGVHSAIDWLLRHARKGDKARPLDWHQSEKLAALDKTLERRPSDERRNWHMTSHGHTMVIVRSPKPFEMGAPLTEAGRKPASDSPDEPQYTVRIPRTFAIASKETTNEQFNRFLADNPDVKARFAYPNNPTRMASVITKFSPEPDTPQIAVTWYEAATYCNWLSKSEGLPESEWVYPSRPEEITSGMKLPADYLHRRGYRLPTEAEWEYAARAGSVTSRFYGSTELLLSEYAWYSRHPQKGKNDPIDPADPQRTWPVGELKPNDLGLFDVYGNVWEWCQNRLREGRPESTVVEDTEDDILLVTDSVSRTRRGGGFPYGAEFMRSANRDSRNDFPNIRRDNVGFRVARTLP
jgi:formylglycine-generating enzyme required for sulfatase activity